MKTDKIKFFPISDKEILDKAIFYLNSLRPILPSYLLRDHCSGAISSLFELFSYLDNNNLTDYGNYSK